VIGGRDRQRRAAEDIAPVLQVFHRLLERIEVQVAPGPLQHLDQATRRRITRLAEIIDVDAELLLVLGDIE
jgi:hypothetical protein